MFLYSFLIAGSLSVVLIVLSLSLSFVSYGNLSEKLSPFECGFDPLSKMRSPFSIRYFLLVVLFLIFDVEIALLFPLLSAFCVKTTLSLFVSLSAFLIILVLGMLHEWNEGALDWVTS